MGAPTRPLSWLRRPPGLVARTRWLFCLGVLMSLPLVLTRTVIAGRASPVLLAAAGLLALLWIVRYASGRTPLVLDLAEAAAVGLVAANGADVAAVLNFVFPALWFRGLFGTTPRVVLFCAYVTTTLLLGVASADTAPGTDVAASTVVLSTIASMFVTTAVARHLAHGLFAREQAQRRDAALVALGQRLIGLTDRGEIQARARSARPRSAPPLPACPPARARHT